MLRGALSLGRSSGCSASHQCCRLDALSLSSRSLFFRALSRTACTALDPVPPCIPSSAGSRAHGGDRCLSTPGDTVDARGTCPKGRTDSPPRGGRDGARGSCPTMNTLSRRRRDGARGLHHRFSQTSSANRFGGLTTLSLVDLDTWGGLSIPPSAVGTTGYVPHYLYG